MNTPAPATVPVKNQLPASLRLSHSLMSTTTRVPLVLMS